ncbi:unnamed protein product [Symbiodinium sp. CCMP2592]|nr:unnamed protein product [Symbiodinium sp. CCMP2592]
MPRAMTPLSLLVLLTLGTHACNVTECRDDVQGLLQLVKRSDPSCAASPHCSKLKLAGACCPTIEGVYLYCCDHSSSHSDTSDATKTTATTTSIRKKPTPDVRVPTHKTVPAAVQLSCSGEGFLECWTFYTEADPTHGYIEYVSETEAKELGLYSLQDGAVRLGSLVGQNEPVKAVRLQSQTRFSPGHIFVIDIKHMPTGEGTWPAWWSYGPDWPKNGEIDTIETVETETYVHSTLHTSAGCRMPSVSGIFNPNCNAGNGNEGCGLDGPAGSGGSVFNENGGGVFATQWTTSGIKMWFFRRDLIPADITSEKPDSATWGKPYVTFPFGSDCPSYHFSDMVLVINLDFCGDWAGSDFPGGSTACIDYVKDPSNANALSEAYWEINYVKVFAAASGSSSSLAEEGEASMTSMTA